jgi:hypothetical protein
MKRLVGAWLAIVLVSSTGSLARADDKDPQPILDKAIQALGGEANLKKAESATWKSKGTITFNGNDNTINIHATVQGLDHYRAEVEGEFGGNEVKGVVVLNGNKGWRKFGEKMEMDEDNVANEKRAIYLQVIPMRILPLKDKSFKVEAAGEEKVGDKPAVGITVTPPDGKTFTLHFDKESGLPVKLVAKVVGFGGEEYTQETLYKDYKDFDGIKKATKVQSKRDGEDFLKGELTEFKALDKVDPKTFAEPE